MSRRRASNSESLASSSVNEAMAYPFSGMQQSNTYPQRRGPIEGPGGRRLVRRVTWRSSTYKLMASLWVLGVLYMVWLIRDIFYLPFSYFSKPAVPTNPGDDLLAQFVGREECGISSRALYLPPHDVGETRFCQNRPSLLRSMSDGGRHGFGAPYASQGCSYRWYTEAEICDILNRFDGISFVGDDSLADAYAGFNILLRQDLKLGSLKSWEMSGALDSDCGCDSQFTNRVCLSARIASSEELLRQKDGEPQSPYICSAKIPHMFLSATGSPALSSAHDKFKGLLNRPSERKKPVAVIQSLSLSTSYSLATAESSIDEWLTLAKTSARDTPFLWVGPTAPGHLNPPGDNVHANSWQYTQETTTLAQSRGIDVLGMYNATVQAQSWDGMHYGEDVALMQAMMIINWLAFL
ncbi:hypothetical protein BDV18DRAFT_167331 [Aspergillus unguis]